MKRICEEGDLIARLIRRRAGQDAFGPIRESSSASPAAIRIPTRNPTPTRPCSPSPSPTRTGPGTVLTTRFIDPRPQKPTRSAPGPRPRSTRGLRFLPITDSALVPRLGQPVYKGPSIPQPLFLHDPPPPQDHLASSTTAPNTTTTPTLKMQPEDDRMLTDDVEPTQQQTQATQGASQAEQPDLRQVWGHLVPAFKRT